MDAADYLQAITNSVGEGLFALDADGMVTFVNDMAVTMLGWPREKFEGAVMHDLTHYRHADGTPYPAEDCPIKRSREEDRSVRVTDDLFIRYDGSDLAVAYTAAPFHTEDGVAGSVVVFRSISEEKAREQRLSEEVDDLRAAGQVREALDHGGFELYAQPVVEIETRRCAFRGASSADAWRQRVDFARRVSSGCGTSWADAANRPLGTR